MRSFLIRSGIVLLASVAQLSFFNVVFPVFPPSPVLALAVSWTLVRGFVPALPWAVGLGLSVDLLSAHTVGLTSLALVAIAYVVSFLSRRFLLERRGLGTLAIAAVVTAAAFFYQALATFGTWWLAGTLSFDASMSALPYLLSGVWSTAWAGLALFFALHLWITRTEWSLDLYDVRIVAKRR
jgi:rod shape-determining protein MreD